MTILVEDFGSWSAIANDGHSTYPNVPNKRGCVLIGWHVHTSIANGRFIRDGDDLIEQEETLFNIYEYGCSLEYNPKVGSADNLNSYIQGGGDAYQSGVFCVLSGVLLNSHTYTQGGYTAANISGTSTPNPDGILLVGGWGKIENGSNCSVVSGTSLGMVGANIAGPPTHEVRGGACYIYGTGAPVTAQFNFPAGATTGKAGKLTFEPDIYPSGVPIFY